MLRLRVAVAAPRLGVCSYLRVFLLAATLFLGPVVSRSAPELKPPQVTAAICEALQRTVTFRGIAEQSLAEVCVDTGHRRWESILVTSRRDGRVCAVLAGCWTGGFSRQPCESNQANAAACPPRLATSAWSSVQAAGS